MCPSRPALDYIGSYILNDIMITSHVCCLTLTGITDNEGHESCCSVSHHHLCSYNIVIIWIKWVIWQLITLYYYLLQFIHILIVMAVDLPYGLTIGVAPDDNKGVCVRLSPFFTNRINRDLHSSKTVKVCAFQTSL